MPRITQPVNSRTGTQIQVCLMQKPPKYPPSPPRPQGSGSLPSGFRIFGHPLPHVEVQSFSRSSVHLIFPECTHQTPIGCARQKTDQSSWGNEEIYWLLQMDRMLLQLPGLKEGLQEPRYKSQNRDSVLPSCSLIFSSLCSLVWLLHLVGKMPCPQPQAHSIQLCAL